jgi:hypothetical protein
MEHIAEKYREITGSVIPSEQKRLREEGLIGGSGLIQRWKSAASHTDVGKWMSMSTAGYRLCPNINEVTVNSRQ